jgi:hypothetical protein
MRARRSVLPLALALLAAPSPAAAGETLRYRWRLDGFVGALASLFVPNDGEGLLTLAEGAGGVVRGELFVTASDSDEGEFFRYGSEWDAASGRTLRAWSDLAWRGEQKSKRAEVDEPGVIDIVSGIHALRRDPPSVPRRLEIWSDGRLYPVLVLPRGSERRKLEAQPVTARRLSVRGLKLTGRKMWKGALDLWIADDPAATPVEILVERKGVRVRLLFVERRTGALAAEETPAEGGS